MGYSRRISVESMRDTNPVYTKYLFWCDGVVVAQCDEDDYHDTTRELVDAGYSISGCCE